MNNSQNNPQVEGTDFLVVEVPITENANVTHVDLLQEIPEFYIKHHNFFIGELSEVMRQKLDMTLDGTDEDAVRKFCEQQGHINGRIELLNYFIRLSSPEYQQSIKPEE